ncbi:cobalt-precorrin-6A reductase [Roseibium sp. M-1]
MTADPPHILLLAGTAEARQLAGRLADAYPHARLTASFAGVVSDLPDLGVPTRIGGFGGVDGLTTYLRQNSVSLVIDATHPFAAQMSRNAAAATTTLGLPLVRLERPGWKPQAGDRWTSVASMDDAAALLPLGARAFLAIGRKEIGRFTGRTDIFGLARMIEAPEKPLPDHWQLILARPAHTVAEEVRLFEQHRITHVVTKNSGGTRSYPKIEAARKLGLAVIMVERPELPSVRNAESVEGIVDLIRDEVTP